MAWDLRYYNSSIFMPKKAMNKTLYNRDFNLWLEQNAHLLHKGFLQDIDVERLIEEIEGLAQSQKQALKSNLRVVLIHLLKYQYQPEKITDSWVNSINEHRDRVYDILDDSPSLEQYIRDELSRVYGRARRRASRETQKPLDVFPTECPFTIEQVLDENYFPQ